VTSKKKGGGLWKKYSQTVNGRKKMENNTPLLRENKEPRKTIV